MRARDVAEAADVEEMLSGEIQMDGHKVVVVSLFLVLVDSVSKEKAETRR